MSARHKGASQRCAAAQAGVSERTGRRMEEPDWKGVGQRAKRTYRTRPDPFAAVWESEIVPLLQSAPGLQAQTILADLQERHPGSYPWNLLRTLQRRVRHWRATQGPEQEIYFPQQVRAGQQALCDFTDMNRLKITIGGAAFPHRLIHVRLRFSGMTYVEVVQGGESFTALARGLRHAFESFGGVPETIRTDSLRAAYRTGTQEDHAAGAVTELTEGFAAFCANYGVKPTRNNPGLSHENGGIESPHGHLKNAIDQDLLLRGSRDFTDVTSYQRWLHTLVGKENARRQAVIRQECNVLKPLPQQAPACYSLRPARVSGNSTIVVARCTYSVPSRLKGQQLSVHLYDDRLEAYLGTECVFETARHRPTTPNARVWCIDYRHVIGSLRRKPGAFRQLAYRDVLHPSPVFEDAWNTLDAQHPTPERAVKIYLEILTLAAQHGEEPVASYLQEVAQRQQALPNHEELQARLHHQADERTAQALHACTVIIRPHGLSDYDALISDTHASQSEALV